MKFSRRAFAALSGAILLAAGLGLAAQAQAPFGPKVGAAAPAVGALADQDGRSRTLDQLAGEKGVVLMFYRSAVWCPFCQAQLIAMNEGLSDIESRGYKLVGLSYDDPAELKTFVQRPDIKYTLLSDPDSEVIDRWGLRDPQYPEGNRAHGVPRPIIFAIDRSGRIVGSIAEERYQDRPPVAEVTAMLDAVR
jgi:peroxiredoxin